MKKIVIIPTFNEADNIVALMQTILETLPVDILVVDDSSPDGTAKLVLGMAQKLAHQKVNLIERPAKLGLGSAYLKGFRWALDNDYEVVFQMDGDASHQPKDLLKLDRASQDYDLVLATRYMKGGRTEGWPLHRLLLSRGANIYARLLTGMPFKDLTGGMKCYKKKALETLCKQPITSDGYAFQIETTFYVYAQGHTIGQVPIVFKDRVAGQSKLSKGIIWEAIFLILHLFMLRFRKRKST